MVHYFQGPAGPITYGGLNDGAVQVLTGAGLAPLTEAETQAAYEAELNDKEQPGEDPDDNERQAPTATAVTEQKKEAVPSGGNKRQRRR